MKLPTRCHSRESGNPFESITYMDPRFREDDEALHFQECVHLVHQSQPV